MTDRFDELRAAHAALDAEDIREVEAFTNRRYQFIVLAHRLVPGLVGALREAQASQGFTAGSNVAIRATNARLTELLRHALISAEDWTCDPACALHAEIESLLAESQTEDHNA